MKIITIAGINYIRAAESARYMNLSRARVSALVKNKQLDSIKIDTMVLVSIDSIDKYMKSNRKPGRKKTNATD